MFKANRSAALGFIFVTVLIDVIGFENNYHDTAHIPIEYLKERGYLQLADHIADVFMIHKDSEFIENCRDLLR
jgi:hypothetical protein